MDRISLVFRGDRQICLIAKGFDCVARARVESTARFPDPPVHAPPPPAQPRSVPFHSNILDSGASVARRFARCRPFHAPQRNPRLLRLVSHGRTQRCHIRLNRYAMHSILTPSLIFNTPDAPDSQSKRPTPNGAPSSPPRSSRSSAKRPPNPRTRENTTSFIRRTGCLRARDAMRRFTRRGPSLVGIRVG